MDTVASGTPMAIDAWKVLAASAGLVAFHVGFYTLIGRERKSPYAINRIFLVFLVALLAASFSLLSLLLTRQYADWCLLTSVGLLVIGFFYSVYAVARIAIRFLYFVDSVSAKHWPLVRQFRRRFSKTESPSYSHDAVQVPDELLDGILSILKSNLSHPPQIRNSLQLNSLAVHLQHQGQANELLAALSMAFFQRGFFVQYLSASRHPIEFVRYLKDRLKSSDKSLLSEKEKFVVIDAYSPHFAFLDSIYQKKNSELKSMGVTCVATQMTYAGLHSATSKAFNAIGDKVDRKLRKPILVIYEDTYALADLESPEQYRIFLRHVLPSERLWDGLFTVFIETMQPSTDWGLLQSSASIVVDQRDKSESQGHRRPLFINKKKVRRK